MEPKSNSLTAVSIRRIPVSAVRRLKARAKANGRSAEAEMRQILLDAAAQQKPEKGLGTLLREFGEKWGPIEFERDKTPTRIPTFE